MQIRGWKEWEQETDADHDYLNGSCRSLTHSLCSCYLLNSSSKCEASDGLLSVYADPSRFRLTHETSFVKDHVSVGSKSAFLFYIVRKS